MSVEPPPAEAADVGDLPPGVLAPLPGPNPAGRDVRYEGDYERIAEARRDENSSLPQGVWVRDVKQADWAAVESLALDTLTQRSKDLRVACWLAEAWVRLDGFSGLRRGLALIDALCAKFWDDLYPVIEPNDLSGRLAPLEWLNQRLPVALRLWPVVAHPIDRDVQFTWSDYIDAQRLETVRLRDPAAAQKAETRGAITLARFEACQKRTLTARLEGMALDLDRSLARLAALDDRLDTLCGRDAPGLGKIRDVAEEIAGFAAAELAARRPADFEPVDLRRVEWSPDPPAAAPASVPTTSAAPMTRSLAYQRLGEIADFLLDADPHSPTPYVLRRLADWGALPLPNLIQAFEDVGGDMVLMLRSLGLEDGLNPAPAENEPDYDDSD
jgi:type VI secretion system protein ImpA